MYVLLVSVFILFRMKMNLNAKKPVYLVGTTDATALRRATIGGTGNRTNCIDTVVMVMSPILV
jgi:hypothetical protein